MISKLAKAQESWIFKIIFAAVAVSFISLFGVTGYISSASQNQTVVNVNGQKTPQSVFSYRLNKELNAVRNIAGDDFDLTDDMRNTLAESVLKQIIDDSVIDQTMLKNSIYFPKVFVQQVLFNMPEFQNPQNGQFNPDLFRRYLSTTGMSENEYVSMIKRLMARKLLITDIVAPFNVPNILSEAIHRMDNQRKTFKYVLVSPSDVVIERSITDDEVQQYFTDFSEQFIIPETRDVEILFVPNSVILNKYAASDEMVREYFDANKKDLDQPQKREVLQMVFLNKETAENALNKLNEGGVFEDIAKEFNAENANELTLGLVSYDELAEGLADEAFGAELNTPKLVQVADSWQIIKVNNIIEAKEAQFEEVKEEIKTRLNDENMYDAIREARAEIDDAINEGKTLPDIANNFGVSLPLISDIKETELIKNMPEEFSSLAKSLDLNEMIYSYGLNEISSTEEFDDGIVVVEVKAIKDAHMPEIDTVKDEIIALWTVQEKNAIAKEIAENIVVDIEDGSDIVDAAKARNLEVFRSEPINRNETFVGLNSYDISDLFLAEKGSVKLYEKAGNNYVIAIPHEVINYTDKLDEASLEAVRSRAQGSMSSDLAKSMLKAYGEDFKIEVDYKKAGFSE